MEDHAEEVKRGVGLTLADWKRVRVPAEIERLATAVVEEKRWLELKAVEALLPIHTAQVVTCLRLNRFPLGLPNLNEVLVKNGTRRILNVPRSREEARA